MGIEREKIDVNTIHGFIVDFDDEWVLLQRVFDFYVDGWVFLRRGDISVIQSKPTEVFQKALLEEEGSLERVDFTRRLPEGGIITMLRGFESDQVVILEEEAEDEDKDVFYIGFIRGVEDGTVSLEFISGEGGIDGEETLIHIEVVTSIAHSLNYTLHYERYFARQRNLLAEE